MQAETSTKATPSPAGIVGIVGGALLVIGSFLTWATATINFDALAQALGVDPSLLQGAATGSQSFSLKGLDSDADGMFTLIAGIVAVVVAIVMIMKADLRKPMGAILILAALVGGGVALYDLSKVNDVKQEALDTAGAGLTALGVDPGVLDDVFDVSAGIGLWVCIAGGLVALVGGVMAVMAKSTAPAMAAGGSAGAGSGFERAPAATAAPAAPPAASPPAATPVVPPAAEPPPAATPPAAEPPVTSPPAPAAPPETAPPASPMEPSAPSMPSNEGTSDAPSTDDDDGGPPA